MKTPALQDAGWPNNHSIKISMSRTDQFALFDSILQSNAPESSELTLEDRFRKFDSENPQVYEAFQGIASQLLARGRKQHGARAILERVRWDFSLATTGDEFKINNNYVAFYARKLIAQDSRFVNFFALRVQGVKRAQS